MQKSRGNQLVCCNRDIISLDFHLGTLLDMAGKVDLKVVLLGKEYGGKTSLVERYIHGKFNSNAPYQSVSYSAAARLHCNLYLTLGGVRQCAGSMVIES